MSTLIKRVMWVGQFICRCDDERYLACEEHPGAKRTDPRHPEWVAR